MPTPTTTEATVIVTSDQHAELMRFAFDQIAPKDDWKGPIECLVPHDLANVYMQAIEFMTGLKPDAERIYIPGSWCLQYKLTCVGYRAGPAGP